MLITPYAPDSPSHNIGRAPTKEAAKAVVVPSHLGIGEKGKTPGGSDGSAGPSIQALGPLEGVDPIEVSIDLSPRGKSTAEPSAQKHRLLSQYPPTNLLHWPTYPTTKTKISPILMTFLLCLSLSLLPLS